MDAVRHFAFPTVRTVGLGRPFVWLRLGWADLAANPAASLSYGLIFAVMGALLNYVFRNAIEYLAALLMAFLLLGPLLCIGLYDLSRQRAGGQHPRLGPSLVAWRSNLGAIGIYVLIISIICLLWARGSLVVFAVFYTQGLPTVSDFVHSVLSFDNLPFLIWWFAEALVFGGLVFAISVVSIPYLVDTQVDAVTAAAASVLTLVRNRAPLALWAIMIVLMVCLGFASLFTLLVPIVPLIGHATWHVYRDLIDADPTLAQGDGAV